MVAQSLLVNAWWVGRCHRSRILVAAVLSVEQKVFRRFLALGAATLLSSL